MTTAILLAINAVLFLYFTLEHKHLREKVHEELQEEMKCVQEILEIVVETDTTLRKNVKEALVASEQMRAYELAALEQRHVAYMKAFDALGVTFREKTYNPEDLS